MKQFFLSFAAMLLFAIGAEAQQVEVRNMTTCPIDVTVEGWAGTPGCTMTGNVNPSGSVTIAAGNNMTFNDPTVTEDFEVFVTFVPGGLTPPFACTPPSVRSAPNSCIAPTVPAGTTYSTTLCGAANGVRVTKDPTGTLANGTIIVDTY